MTRSPRPTGRPRGFTLVELLVVIAIIAILVAILLPAVQKVREAANRARCQNTLKQMAVAVYSYNDMSGSLPPGGVNPGSGADAQSWSWQYFILPYMEQQELYTRASDPATRSAAIIGRGTPYLRCPSDGDRRGNAASNSATNYVASLGPQRSRSYGWGGCPCGNVVCSDPFTAQYANRPDWGYGDSGYLCSETTTMTNVRGMFFGNVKPTSPLRVRVADVLDGTSNTIMLGETLPGENRHMGPSTNAFSAYQCANTITTLIDINTFTPWPGPGAPAYSDINCPVYGNQIYGNWAYSTGFKSRHSSGANFAFGDGTVRFVGEKINPKRFQQLGCRHDANFVDPTE